LSASTISAAPGTCEQWIKEGKGAVKWLDPNSSLTIWDASSSRVTLLIMLVAVAVFLPIVLAYTAFVHRVLRGRVTTAYVEDSSIRTRLELGDAGA
jgi:small-conductance mechanosensitive channel